VILAELDTPVPVVRLSVVEDNLARMQAYCDRHGLKLRPHIKTHKIVALARRQIELGAAGITCQKLSEAEVMVDGGIDDVLISYPLIGTMKAERLARLAARAAMTVVVDSGEGVATIAEAARIAQRKIAVLVEFDSGARRTGVQTPEEVLPLAKAVRGEPLLEFRGDMTYPLSDRTAPFVRATKDLLAREGIGFDVVSGGGTPGAYSAHLVEGLTELRVGTYIYNDRTIIGLTSETADNCAFHVVATVVSRPTPDRAIIDAGSKTLSSDLVPAQVGTGHGLIVDYPDAAIERLNEEHGMVDLSKSARKPAIGERLTIVPNHVCVVTNLHDEVYFTRDGSDYAAWKIDARGRTA
jgi:D-serine deaminase-like pyridoxal phosphate-dependent protein